MNTLTKRGKNVGNAPSTSGLAGSVPTNSLTLPEALTLTAHRRSAIKRLVTHLRINKEQYMAYSNQEFTHHVENHFPKAQPNCDYCPSYTDTPAYFNQLRNVLLGLLEKYPDRYTLIDYVEACELALMSIV